MRKNKRKREKFGILLLKSMSIAVVISVIFGFAFYEKLMYDIQLKSEQEINNSMTNLLAQLTKYQSEDRMNEFGAYLSIYGSSYDVIVDENGMIQIVPQYVEGCSAAAALIDEDNNIVASSKKAYSASLVFSKDDKRNGLYTCDRKELNMPEVDEFYRQADAIKSKSPKGYCWLGIRLESAYVNTEKNIIIPHRGYFEIERVSEDEKQAMFVDNLDIERETEEINIDLENDEGFEIIDLQGLSGKEENIIKYGLSNFHGTPESDYDEISKGFRFQNYTSYSSGGYYSLGNGSFSVEASRPVFFDGKSYFLEIKYIVNAFNPMVQRYYWTITLIFSGIVLLIAFLLSWRRYIIKKAAYDFEDYQRNLTNSLAHDLKTPLMAMSGYTENIIEGSLSAEEGKSYLHSILDNIAYADRIITNALELDKMSMSETDKKEKIDLCELANRITEKYALMLDERNITIKINGGSVIETDRLRVETIIENLVSNAVKYTPENGNITITADKKSFAIVNTVEEKIDVTELKKPFVRGEKSRSGKGSGLGLAIADAAAGICGAKLIISCSENEFAAVLKF